jgi:hypothetical protein
MTKIGFIKEDGAEEEKPSVSTTSPKLEVPVDELHRELDKFFEKYKQAASLQEADDNVFCYTTKYFFDKIVNHYPVEGLTGLHIYNYLTKKGFKSEVIPESNVIAWLMKEK